MQTVTHLMWNVCPIAQENTSEKSSWKGLSRILLLHALKRHERMVCVLLHCTSRLADSQQKDTAHPISRLMVWQLDKKLWTETQECQPVRKSGVFLLSTLAAYSPNKKVWLEVKLLLFAVALWTCNLLKYKER